MCTENRSISKTDNFFDLLDFIHVADAMKKVMQIAVWPFLPLPGPATDVLSASVSV